MEDIGTQTTAVRGRAGRVAVLLALVCATAVSLRGRLPETRSGRGRSGDSVFTLAGLIALLGVSLLVTAIALVYSARKPKTAVAAGRHEVPGGLGGGEGNWKLRLILMALGLVLSTVVAFVLAQQIRIGPDFGQETPVTEIADGATPPPPQVRAATRADKDAFWYLVGTSALLTVMIVASGIASARKRPKPEAAVVPVATPTAVEPAPEPLAAAAEAGLAEVGDLSREPREAIIACYAAMERALADAPEAAPQAADTPSEVLARAVGKGALSPGNASTLVALFTEARFSSHVMTEQDRDAAEQALRSVLGELRSRR